MLPSKTMSSVRASALNTPACSTSRVARLARIRPATGAPRGRVPRTVRTHVNATKAEQDLEEAYSDAVSSWDELSTMASLAYAILAGAETYDVNGLCRIRAAESIGPNSTFDCLAPMGAVQHYADALDGTLFNSTTVIDTHYRILKDCLVQDDYDLVQSTYHRLANIEPKMEEELVVSTAAVGAQALEYLKEEHEIVVAMLAEEVGDEGEEGPSSNIDESMRRDYLTSKAIMDGVNKIISLLPQ